jgi:hypothetical protein
MSVHGLIEVNARFSFVLDTDLYSVNVDAATAKITDLRGGAERVKGCVYFHQAGAAGI